MLDILRSVWLSSSKSKAFCLILIALILSDIILAKTTKDSLK